MFDVDDKARRLNDCSANDASLQSKKEFIMSAVGSISSGLTAQDIAAPKLAPVKINDGDADDMPKAAAPAKLATSGPGQLINKLA